MPSRPVRTTPWRRYCSASRASRSSFRTRHPPSLVVMFLFAWKLNETKSPKEPIRLPFQVLPKRLRGVLDNPQPALRRQGIQAVAVHRQAGQVDRDDRPGARRDGRLDAAEVDRCG